MRERLMMKKYVKRMVLLLVAGALIGISAALSAGCGGDENPSDVVRQIIEAYNSGDFGSVYDLSSASLKQQAGERETSIQMMASQWPPGTSVSDLEITSEQIDGDRATVGWKGTLHMPDVPDKAAGAMVTLVKENGQWLLDQPAGSAPASQAS